ncbi:MAG: FUSC family protein, partial [Pseudomonadota bacterium]|nr:FUSC family protein [Pseudomonadota bacterium]
NAAPQPRFVFDLDRMAAAARVMAGLWLAYVAWIYTQIPGGTAFVIMAGPIGMALATMPQMRVSMLFVPVAVSVAFASLLYIFVMPQLSSFAGLGLMIFAVTFAICYLFHTPKQGLGRAFGLAMFVTIAGVSNQQSYSFLSAANTALMFPLVFAVLALAANIPFSARPEKAFLRLLGRFFRSCEHLMTTMPWHITTTPTRLDCWRKAFHAREVATLPQKLATWGKAVDTSALPGTTPEQVQTLTTNLQAITYRMQELMDARESPQAQFLVGELLTDVRAWRLKVQEAFQAWSRGVEPASADALRERLTARLAQLERRIAETMNKAAEGELSNQDRERLYRLLGAYRGLSEAGAEYARTVDGIDWDPWRESRF